MEIDFTINKREIYDRVAQTTSYTGAKMTDDNDALDRISTVDEDTSELERFWQETDAEMGNELVRLIAHEQCDGDKLIIKLNVSESFDMALKPSMDKSLKSYFVQSIAGKWFVYTNKKEAGQYAASARSMLQDFHAKAVHKAQPTIPNYYTNRLKNK